jgi:hypothetical protein
MNSIKILSPTYALDLTTSASSALEIVPNTPTRAFRIALLNTGSGKAAVNFGTTAAGTVDPTIGATGSSGSFVLPGGMIFPIYIDCPAPNVFIKGISSSTNTLYMTLVATE